ncbi:MAG: universal stress protein [Candidatus Hydrothermarchaeaceae archaeon]
MRILMCTDGSKQAEDAIRFGNILVKNLECTITVLGVVEHSYDQARVEASMANAKEILKDVDIETKTRVGYADEEIVKESEEGYDLIILGSVGRRGIARFLIGPTAAKVVKYARTSVLVVKGARDKVSKVLICTGGGERGIEDVKYGGKIAKATGAEVNVLHCMSQIPMLDIEEKERRVLSEFLGEKTREAEHLKKGCQILGDLGIKCDAKLRYGLVENEIFDEVREGNYDLLVIGAHATVGLSRYLLGDIAGWIVDHAGIPVLVVKTPKHIM